MRSLDHDGAPLLDRCVSTGVAALLVLVVHLLVFAPFVVGFSATVKAAHGADSRRTPASDATLVFAEIVQPSRREPSKPDLVPTLSLRRPAQQSLALVRLQSLLIAPSMLMAETDEAGEQQPARYRVPPVVRRIGEITARLQAAWVLPPRSVAAAFRCRVRVTQDETGALSGIEMQRCDDDPALRASLVAAVRAASPLPALDDAEHSAWDLTLEFKSFASSPARWQSSVEPSTSAP